MLELTYIIGLTIALMENFKSKLTKPTIPLISIGVCIILNVINALVFNGNIQESVKEAIIQSGIFFGLFTAGSTLKNAVKNK